MLKERIEILRTAGVINDAVAGYTDRVIDLLGNGYAMNKLEMFTTHLAMATQRICNEDPVEELDDLIWNEIRTSPYYQQAEKLYEQICELSPVEYPVSEKKFLIMHICNLMQKDGGE